MGSWVAGKHFKVRVAGVGSCVAGNVFFKFGQLVWVAEYLEKFVEIWVAGIAIPEREKAWVAGMSWDAYI